MDRYLRVFKFVFEVWGMSRKNTNILKPMVYNVAAAVPVMAALSLLFAFIESEAMSYVLLVVGITALYFIDYYCAGMTASLIYDQVTTGSADVQQARRRATAAAPGILTFAAISAAFDILASYAQERDDLVGKILTQVLYAVWTTATFVVMPSMVIEGVGFGAAFSRSKELMKQDPTNVGTGVIGIGAVNYVLGAVVFGLAHFVSGALSSVHPVLGAFAFFLLVNLYWAVSGFIKISYFTCFYLWALECERKGTSEPSLAPAPLAAALA
jgi:hypothetical protein